MMDLSALPLPLILALSFAGGLLLGYAYFRSLRVAVELIVGQGRPLLAVALTCGRMAVLALGLYAAVQAGGSALLAAFGGILCAKALLLRQVRRDDA